MKKENKCYRCKTILKVNEAKNKMMVECPHCHAIHMPDKKSDRLIFIVKALMYLLVFSIIVFVTSALNVLASQMNLSFLYYVFLGISFFIFLSITKNSDKTASAIANSLFGITYIQYEEKTKKKK